MERIYDAIIREHICSHRQMAFVSGPRQVGKTTTCRAVGTEYFNWDSDADRRVIVAGAEAVAAQGGLQLLREAKPVLVFDELHKYARWKSFLKGFFDGNGEKCHVMVTGSSRLDVFRRGGDSLMGRYFPYRMHPVSVSEWLHRDLPGEGLIRPPLPIESAVWDALWHHGGFPEPFLKGDDRFTRRWRRLRHEQVFKEDLRELSRVQEVAMIGILGQLLGERSGEQLVMANLAQDVGVAPNTIRSWIEVLCSLHVGFLVRPWFRNVASSLRKEPKWFLRDWSEIADEGKRFETLVACHLLKAVEAWTDLGHGQFELRYLRDKQKREVDFLVVRDGQPWFLVEAKLADTALSKNLAYFQQQTRASHAFQIVRDLPFVASNAFERRDPVVVPACTLLSQWV